ncbi:EamA family transporter [candidate division TA06 bacterium]|uniref:EamA family transporter n=1 Tax=candidate division TA06 bacterium TaxID=2250710 RepID=A0A933MKJ1_UNCT6|nr:EamA family transporter [candidate division TA06 bacterium]
MYSKKISILYALVAASLFGASAPLAKLLLTDIHPVLLASFLYMGSGLGLLFYKLTLGLGQKDLSREAKLGRADLPWLAGATVSGGIAAPIVLLFSLKHTPAATASLILNFEGVATALIASLAFREAVSKRIWLAVILVTIAVILLSVDLSDRWGFSLGAMGVVAACVLWGLDNNFTRNTSAKDPIVIVIVKGIAAGAISLALALLMGNSFPGLAKVLLACVLGLVCYGLSIVFFIFSLRELGTARTSAYFAAAPFIGSVLSFLIFRELPNALFLVALPFIVAGAFLLFTEKHLHLHTHFEFEHDHFHDHLDGHHAHRHPEGGGAQKHSHPHQHDPVAHQHPHNPDIHHRHSHED